MFQRCTSYRVNLTMLAMAASAITADDTKMPRDYPIQPIPFHAVTIDGGFWKPRMDANRTTTVPYDFEKCEETGRIANFARAGGLEPGKFEGICYNDSDVFKVIEGAAYTLALVPDRELDRYLDALILKIAAAQEDDGYLYTARRLNAINVMTGRERWSNLRVSHELYNVGHLYEAAVAHWQATGKRTLLQVAIKNADLICRLFGPGEEQIVDVPGHEEIEIGLVKLYRATGEQKYLDTAKFFVDSRGNKRGRKQTYGPSAQDHVPIAEQTEAVGHAVRAGYLYAGVADVAALTGESRYVQAVNALWENIVTKKLYLTGGIGARSEGEAFGDAYELPNATAYNETCAAIANALFNHRMFLLHGDSRSVDVLERILYNGFLAGISFSGNRFFYPNPLASSGDARKEWFETSCCPVNVVRFLPSISGLVYGTKGEDVYLNLFIDSHAKIPLKSGAVELTQKTAYPWSGKVALTVSPSAEKLEFALRVRVPGWVSGRPVPGDLYRYLDASPAAWSIKVNGQSAGEQLEGGYAVIRRVWTPKDQVDIEFGMPVRRVIAHENVEDNKARVAIERGPIVFCAEAVDQPDGRVTHLVLPDDASLNVEHCEDLLGGVDVVTCEAASAIRANDGQVELRPARMSAVPYYAWAHRKKGEMAVWLAREPGVARPLPAPTIASRAKATASHTWSRDTIDALHDQIEPSKSSDHTIARFTWWDRRGTSEWVQYDFARPTLVTTVEVYWFDDTGTGQCRVPASWRIVYRDGGEWKPVVLTGKSTYTSDRNRFNVVSFAPVESDAVRLEVNLQPEFSAGILEWRVR